MNQRSILSIGAFALVLTFAYYGTELWLARKLDARIAALAHQLPSTVKVAIGQSSVRLFGYQAKVADVTVSGPAGRFRIDEVVFDRFDFTNEVPHYAHGTVRGLTLAADELAPGPRGVMTGLGYQQAVLDIAFGYRYDPDKALFVIENFRVSGPEVGDLKLDAEIVNVVTLKPETPLAAAALVLRAALHKATLTYRDAGLAPRVEALGARQAGLAVADYRARLEGDFADAMAKTHDDGPREAMAGLKAFVQHPAAVTLTAQPREPVPLFRVATAGNAATALRLLGVTVKTGP